MEANGATEMPPLNPSNVYLSAVLASFNQLSAVPLQLAGHGATLRKLHLGCNHITSVDVVKKCICVGVYIYKVREGRGGGEGARERGRE